MTTAGDPFATAVAMDARNKCGHDKMGALWSAISIACAIPLGAGLKAVK